MFATIFTKEKINSFADSNAVVAVYTNCNSQGAIDWMGIRVVRVDVTEQKEVENDLLFKPDLFSDILTFSSNL